MASSNDHDLKRKKNPDGVRSLDTKQEDLSIASCSNIIQSHRLAASNVEKCHNVERSNIFSLPLEMIEEILSYMTFDDLAKLRGVSRFFNNLCSDKLSKGFVDLESFHLRCLRGVKSRLPRRESERKNHPLARHSDILMSVETRLSMLSMTYMKYIDARQCCFIPGKVLDEAYKLLRIVRAHAQNLDGSPMPRPHDFLQEFRDISSMAMEHFDDKILPAIRERMREGRIFYFRPKEFKQHQSLGINIRHGQIFGCHQVVGHRPAPALAETAAEPLRQPDLLPKIKKLTTGLKNVSSKCCKNEKNVTRAVRHIGAIKRQSLAVQRKLNHYRAMVKSLRRDLRETRNALSVMAKDLNRMKQDHPRVSDGPSSSRLSVTPVCTISCIPEEEKICTRPLTGVQTRGMKRKSVQEQKPEVPRKRKIIPTTSD